MRYLVLLLIGWLSLPVMAMTQVDIYRAEVVINSEQENGESLAREQGMKDVIVRATGSKASLSNPVIQKALNSSARYISQLGYGQLNGQSSLKMRFNEGQIHALLSQAKLPSWPPQRSNILVWLVEEQAYERTIAWEHSDSPNIAALRDAAGSRGLPVTLPIGDFEDITGVNVSDFWGGFAAPIAKASQRYPVDAVLVLRVQGNQVRWKLYDQSPSAMMISQRSPLNGSASGTDAIAETVASVTDHYASKSAVVVTGESSAGITMKVLNINSASDFFRLESALNKLNSVAGTEVKRVHGNELTLTLHLLASKTAFANEASSISQLNEYHQPVQSLTEEPAMAMDKQPADLLQEPSLRSGVVSTEVPEESYQEIEPAVTQPKQGHVDVIYEWAPGQRS